MPAETAAKISATLKGRRKSDAHRASMQRARRGEGNARARLVEADVVAIRAAVATGEPQARVAARYGVTQSVVSRIVNRRAWAHVP